VSLIDGKFATGVNNANGKFVAGVNNANGKFAAGVTDTGGKIPQVSTPLTASCHRYQ
jgi:hypothetical protein